MTHLYCVENLISFEVNIVYRTLLEERKK